MLSTRSPANPDWRALQRARFTQVQATPARGGLRLDFGDRPRAGGIRRACSRQDPPPTLIGERCNAQGSRKFKRLLLEEDYDSILEIAREQVEYGAHALDKIPRQP